MDGGLGAHCLLILTYSDTIQPSGFACQLVHHTQTPTAAGCSVFTQQLDNNTNNTRTQQHQLTTSTTRAHSFATYTHCSSSKRAGVLYTHTACSHCACLAHAVTAHALHTATPHCVARNIIHTRTINLQPTTTTPQPNCTQRHNML